MRGYIEVTVTGRTVLVATSAITDVWSRGDGDGADIYLGTEEAPLHVTESYDRVKELIGIATAEVIWRMSPREYRKMFKAGVPFTVKYMGKE